MGESIALWVGVAVGVISLLGALLGAVAKFNTLESKVDALRDDFTASDARIEKVERRVDHDLSKLETQITSLRSELQTGFSELSKTQTEIIFRLGDKSDRNN